ARPGADTRAGRGAQELHGAPHGRRRGERQHRLRRRAGVDPARLGPPLEPTARWDGGSRMTQEIVDAVKMLEQEKGISADKLMDALQDALLSAYKKTPGAAKYAVVELDHGTADFR